MSSGSTSSRKTTVRDLTLTWTISSLGTLPSLALVTDDGDGLGDALGEVGEADVLYETAADDEFDEGDVLGADVAASGAGGGTASGGLIGAHGGRVPRDGLRVKCPGIWTRIGSGGPKFRGSQYQ